MANCPKCGNVLKSAEYNTIRVPYCSACGGVWLKDSIRQKLSLPKVRSGRGVFRSSGTIKCPACSLPLQEHEYLPGAGVVVDSCPSCGGTWFDKGELQLIRRILRQSLRKPVGYRSATQMDKIRAGSADRDFRKSGIVYLFQLLSGMPVEAENKRKSFPVVTLSLVLINIGVFILTWLNGDLVYEFGAIPGMITQGRSLHTLLTYQFLHGGIIHILGNLYFLWMFGDNIEDTIKSPAYLLFYLAAGVAAALSYCFTATGINQQIVLIGASGAIAGLMGAYMIMFYDKLLYVIILFFRVKVPAPFYLLFWIGYQFLNAYAASGDATNIAWGAHIGGFIFGAVLAVVFGFRRKVKS